MKGNEYSIIFLLGKGASSVVYKVKNVKNEEHFAVKIIDKDSLVRSKDKIALAKEIKIHRKLDHKNIIKFIDCDEDNENIYLRLELAEPNDLNEIIKKGEKIDVKKDSIDIKYQSSEFPSPELVLVSQNDKFGVIKRDGSVIIPLRYQFVRPQSAPKTSENATDSQILYGSTNEVYKFNDMVNDSMKKSAKDFSETMKKVAVGVIIFPFMAVTGLALITIGAPFLLLFILAIGGSGGC